MRRFKQALWYIYEYVCKSVTGMQSAMTIWKMWKKRFSSSIACFKVTLSLIGFQPSFMHNIVAKKLASIDRWLFVSSVCFLLTKLHTRSSDYIMHILYIRHIIMDIWNFSIRSFVFQRSIKNKVSRRGKENYLSAYNWWLI